MLSLDIMTYSIFKLLMNKHNYIVYNTVLFNYDFSSDNLIKLLFDFDFFYDNCHDQIWFLSPFRRFVAYY